MQSMVTGFAAIVVFLIAAAFILIAKSYCSKRTEYDAIVDVIEDTDIENPPLEMDVTHTQYEQASPTTAADVLVHEIDYAVRHMEGFYAAGFYCSMATLEKQLQLPPKQQKKSLAEFIRKRPEFKMRSNKTAFKLTRLTPFRVENVQVSGKFQCVNVMCKHNWTSLCSFADQYQKCKQCKARVYPYEQNTLTKDQMIEYSKNPKNENFLDVALTALAAKRDAVGALYV